MKQFFVILLALISFSATAQNDKYLKAMEPKVAALDTARGSAVLLDLANTFERIATAEKKEWLPFYYAALAQTNYGYSKMGNGVMGGADATLVDPIADKADALLAQAETLSPNNSEVFVVRKMILSLRMLVDPMTRYMTFAPAAAEALAKAKSLNPENPRVYMLEGQDKLYTPEQFGGSKAEAKELFETAMQKFKAAKPETALAPNWGRGRTAYFMTQTN